MAGTAAETTTPQEVLTSQLKELAGGLASSTALVLLKAVVAATAAAKAVLDRAAKAALED